MLFSAAVVSPDFDMLGDWYLRHTAPTTDTPETKERKGKRGKKGKKAAAAQKRTVPSREELIADKLVIARYQKVMDKYNAELGETERVKKFILVTETWSESNKMLTPTQKLIRRNVEAAYKEQIENMFK